MKSSSEHLTQNEIVFTTTNSVDISCSKANIDVFFQRRNTKDPPMVFDTKNMVSMLHQGDREQQKHMYRERVAKASISCFFSPIVDSYFPNSVFR